MSVPKMAPGQEPYTEQEWATVRVLVADAARIQEELSPDEMNELEKRAMELDLHGGEQ